MDALTRSLLDLSQLETLDSEIQFEDVDLAALMRDLAEPYASRAEQADRNFNLEIAGDSVNIKGDAAQFCSPVSTAGATPPLTQAAGWAWPLSKLLQTSIELQLMWNANQLAQCL